MESSLRVATVLVTVVSIAFACSSTPSRPPIETGTGSTPGATTGAGTVKTDAAPPASDDAGTPVTPAADSGVEAGVCSAGGCGGCCNALNECVTGTTNTACGVLGVPCAVCNAGSNCSGGYCQ
jgi:hypothetical protein